MATTTSTFEQVLTEFKKKLTPEQEKEFAATTIDGLKTTIMNLQAEQMSSRKGLALTRTQGFLEAVQAYSQVLDVFVNVHNFVAFIWGPMKFLLLTANHLAEAFSALNDSYQRIAENLPTLAQYQALFEKDPAMRQALETIFQDIFKFHEKAIHYFTRGLWRQMFEATWKHFDVNFKGLLSDMGHHKRMVETQASLIEFREAKSARELEAKKHDQYEKEEAIRRKMALRSWLSAANIFEDQDRGVHARRHHPQSGKWLLAQDKFKTWADPDMSLKPALWINGIPGAGKSVLASVVVEKLQHGDENVLWFYCRTGSPEREGFVAMARSFITQAMHYQESLVAPLFETAVKGDGNWNTLTTGNLAQRLLEDCLQALEAFGNVFIVLDGIDECPNHEQKHMVRFLRTYVEQSARKTSAAPIIGPVQCHSRCLFLSQDDSTTRSLLAMLPTISITSKHNGPDIEAYCDVWSLQLRDRFKLTDTKAAEIASRTAINADGMFLFAKLVMSNLISLTRRAQLEAEMRPEIFPSGLHEAYRRITDRILEQAPKAQRRDALRLLSWLVCAVRPLKWREIQAAVSIDSDRQILDFEELGLRDNAKDLCGSLVEAEKGPDGDVTLVHATAKGFLLGASPDVNNSKAQETYVNQARTNMELVELCIDYLCFPFFDNPVNAPDDQNRELDERITSGRYSLLDYAIVGWAQHLEASFSAQQDGFSLKSVDESLNGFFDLHYKDPVKKCRVLDKMKTISAASSIPTVRDCLATTMASMHALLSFHMTDDRAIICVNLFEVLDKVRKRTEFLAGSDPTKRLLLDNHYGTKHFKCPRLYCKWFYEGFKTQQERDTHVQKHERSHYCLSGGCTRATLGFATKSELDEHVATTHTVAPKDDDFLSDTEACGQAASAARPLKRPADHMCPICHKTFTKASNLRAHELIHTNTKAFKCTICSQAFVRRPDRDRHEALHNGEKRHSCSSPARSGTSIGCGKKFARADALVRHLSSKAGRICRRAIADEEAAAKADAAAQEVARREETTRRLGQEEASRRLPTYTELEAQERERAGIFEPAEVSTCSSAFLTPNSHGPADFSLARTIVQTQTITEEMIRSNVSGSSPSGGRSWSDTETGPVVLPSINTTAGASFEFVELPPLAALINDRGSGPGLAD